MDNGSNLLSKRKPQPHESDSIWFPWTVHALMNFYWEIFSISKTALGGWFPFFLQWITILLAALLTWKATRKQSAAQGSI